MAVDKLCYNIWKALAALEGSGIVDKGLLNVPRNWILGLVCFIWDNTSYSLVIFILYFFSISAALYSLVTSSLIASLDRELVDGFRKFDDVISFP